MTDAHPAPPHEPVLHRITRAFERAEEHRWANPAALILFLLGAAAAASSLGLEARSRHATQRQNDVLLASERLLSSVKDVETGSRGYALTGDEAYLPPLADAERLLPAQLARLPIADDQRRSLTEQVRAKEAFARAVIDARRQNSLRVPAELAIMTRIRAMVSDIQSRAQHAVARIAHREAVWTSILGVVSGVCLPLSFLWVMAAGLLRRRRARIAVDRLRLSEERHRSLIESSASIIWTANTDGRLRGRQRSWMAFTGQTADQYAAEGWLDVVHPEDRDTARRAWADAVAANAMFQTEMRIRRVDGAWRTMQARAVPLLSYGTTREWVGTHTDITEQRQAEDQLRIAVQNAELANQAKSEFLANMSHELRTPLSAIIGYSELMTEEIESGCDAQELAPDMAKVESNARHLLGLINDVLDLSKIESGKMDVYAEPFAVDPVLRDMAATVDALVGKKGNTLALDLAPDLGEARTDLVKTRQILLNLLGNAAKFTENGAITLIARRDTGPDGADRLRLSVRDSGIGMSEDQLARLFERFTQADLSTTRRFGGTGLGLSLSRAFADLLGGSIEVQSEPGLGSTFTLNLPATYRPPAAAADTPENVDLADPSDPAPDPDGEPARDLILVIDDDADQRDLIARVLLRERFRVQLAPDGLSGVAMARRLRPRAILLDVLMPGIDGWSVLTELKSDPELRDIPVVMVTSVDQRSLAASLGAADYVMKPIRWDRLGQVVNRFRTQHGRILLVEDEFTTRSDLRRALEQDGWTVTEAANGREALERAQQDHPTMVLLDLGMPVMDGFDFLEELRRAPGCEDIPVVVLTGRALSREDRHRLRGASQILNMEDVTLQALTERLQTCTDHGVGSDPPGQP